MLGKIENYDETTHTGTVKYENEYLQFHRDQWTADVEPQAGDDVDFDHDGDLITDIGPVGAYLVEMKPVKSRIIAGLLGIAFGAIGLHRFYLGFYGLGVTQIAVTLLTGGYGVIWGFIEGVLILLGHIYKDAKGRHLK